MEILWIFGIVVFIFICAYITSAQKAFEDQKELQILREKNLILNINTQTYLISKQKKFENLQKQIDETIEKDKRRERYTPFEIELLKKTGISRLF